MTKSAEQSLTSLLAFLFTDVVGSTDLKTRLGDVEGAKIIAEHDAAFRACVEEFGGTERVNPGDGFFATFPVPSAALKCALAFQAALAKQQVESRVGIHMGEAVHVPGAAEGEKLLGLAVDTAGRVMSLARGNQILITRHAFDSARQQVLEGPGGEPVLWRAHGPYVLKGLDEPIEIHDGYGTRPASSRHLDGPTTHLPVFSDGSLKDRVRYRTPSVISTVIAVRVGRKRGGRRC